jgi:hypothetical protein
VSSFHDDRRSREDNRNERSIRERAEDGALGAAGVAVVQRSRSLPANVHTEDPRTVLSRIEVRDRWREMRPLYEEAVHMAALWTVLAAAIDRAEHADPNIGDAA